MLRSETPYPLLGFDLPKVLQCVWEQGWLDEYSEDHFLIKAIEKRLTDFVGKQQLINNNLNLYNIVLGDDTINVDSFCTNFCINFSMKLKLLIDRFGENNIKKFITDQMSAGKDNYREDAFFEALSEVSILAFLCRVHWTYCEYEPVLNNNVSKANPEARFVFDDGIESFSVNVEVKSPSFSHDTHNDHKIIIPTVLLTENGIKKVKRFCKRHEIVFLPPRVLKIRDFLNSASKKFTIPKENEVNILYINWSYRDFPSNGYLEAWSLLTNKTNGILTNPIYAKTMGVDLDVFKKISAVIVYTESLEGLMFQSFEYVWQSNVKGPRFRLWVNREIIGDENRKLFQILHDITQMNPSQPLTQYVMADLKSKTDEEQIEERVICTKLSKIVSENAFKL